ncbi:MAG: hypothetical protein M3011_00290 [Actinomycetota bacterium]|nr:hypothetical protein [Actinomycetota bacterium]
MDPITCSIGDHGTFTSTTGQFDVLISRYLPASPAGLRAIVAERSEVDYSDVRDVSALLLILGELDGLVAA